LNTSGRREHWRSRFGIIFATSGSAIGLGTLWKLPYLVGQGGGGAFIILFLVFTLLLGTPLFIAEMALGKHYQKSVTTIFSTVPSNSGFLPIFGWMAIISTILIAGWYGVVSGWGLNYLLMALTDGFSHRTPENFAEIFLLFRQSGSLNLMWFFIFVVITCLILMQGVRNGIEYFSKIFFSVLFLLVIILFIYSTTLSGFTEALHYILYPDWSKLSEETILTALGLSLFALSLGQGIMITYGGYLTASQSILKTAFIVVFSVIGISILISLMIFPMVFTFGLPPEAGEGLLFVTMPFVTEQLPGSMVISALFFILLVFAALTSYIGQLEVLVSSFMETYKFSRIRASVVAGACAFIMGIPTALMLSSYNPFPSFEEIFHRNFFSASNIIIDWMLIIFSLSVCFVVGFRMNREELAHLLNIKNESFAFNIWYWLIRALVPLCLLVVALARVFGWNGG